MFKSSVYRPFSAILIWEIEPVIVKSGVKLLKSVYNEKNYSHRYFLWFDAKNWQRIVSTIKQN